MKTSNFPIFTLKNITSEAELISHKLMIKSGIVRQLTSGLYTWLPLGHRILEKIKMIIREEMNAIGSTEILMPLIQPAELWKESNRWEEYGPELLRINDRHKREFCFGPTFEEVITDLIRKEISSYYSFYKSKMRKRSAGLAKEGFRRNINEMPELNTFL